MDYQEVIETLQDIHDVAESRIKNGDARGVIYIPPDKLEDVKTAISALQELREYKENEKRNLPRTNRLMDECTYRHENGNCLKIGGFCTSVPTSHCQRYKELHNEYTEYKKLGTLEEVREAVKTVRRYKTQYLDDMKNPLEPLKISSALKSEIMKLELRKQSKPESISVLDYTIIAALQKVLYEVCGEEE